MQQQRPAANALPRDSDEFKVWFNKLDKESLNAWFDERAKVEDHGELAIQYTVMLLGLLDTMTPSVDEKALSLLFDKASEGCADADRRLRLFAQHFIKRGDPIPEPLRTYVCKILSRQGPRLKAGRPDNSHHIVNAVRDVAEFGFSVRDACFIVSIALGRLKQPRSADAVQKLWTRRGKLLYPDKIEHPESA